MLEAGPGVGSSHGLCAASTADVAGGGRRREDVQRGGAGGQEQMKHRLRRPPVLGPISKITET